MTDTKGYGYFFYVNNSDKKLVEDIDLTECDIIKLVCSNKGMKKFTAEVLPG